MLGGGEGAGGEMSDADVYVLPRESKLFRRQDAQALLPPLINVANP